jgi:hypothetical protein
LNLDEDEYVDYKSLYNIELRGSIFVTHAKSNAAYKRTHNNAHEEGGPIISDVLIELTGPTAKTHYPKPLRKIKHHDKKTSRTYKFLTNDMGRDAQEVADIYKERWGVELFFKGIKQHLKIRSFWGTNENAVYSQIWAALILTILSWINRTVNEIVMSVYEPVVCSFASLPPFYS